MKIMGVEISPTKIREDREKEKNKIDDEMEKKADFSTTRFESNLAEIEQLILKRRAQQISAK